MAAGADPVGELRAGEHVDLVLAAGRVVDHPHPFAHVHELRARRRHVLHERASGGDVEHLAAAADAEHGLAVAQAGTSEPELRGVEAGVPGAREGWRSAP